MQISYKVSSSILHELSLQWPSDQVFSHLINQALRETACDLPKVTQLGNGQHK